MIAHPGHELRVHGWVERARPLVFVLTDGSGGAGQPRILVRENDGTAAVRDAEIAALRQLRSVRTASWLRRRLLRGSRAASPRGASRPTD